VIHPIAWSTTVPTPPTRAEIPREQIRSTKPLLLLWAKRFRVPKEELLQVWGPSKSIPQDRLYKPVRQAVRKGANVVRFALVGTPKNAPRKFSISIQVGTAPLRTAKPLLPDLASARWSPATEPESFDLGVRLMDAIAGGGFAKSASFREHAVELVRQTALLRVFETLDNWLEAVRCPETTVWLAMDFGGGDAVFFGALTKKGYVWLLDKKPSKFPPPVFEAPAIPDAIGPLRADLGPFADEKLPPKKRGAEIDWCALPRDVADCRTLSRVFARECGLNWRRLAPVWERSRGVSPEWLDEAIRAALAKKAPVLLIYATDGAVGADIREEWFWLQYACGSYETEKWTEPSKAVPWDYANQLHAACGNGDFEAAPQFENDYRDLAELDFQRDLADAVAEWARKKGKIARRLRIDVTFEDERHPVAEIGPAGATIRLGESYED